MMFKNLAIYRLPKSWAIDTAKLEEQLSQRALQACGTTDAQSIGWVAPRASGNLVHAVNRQILLALGIEQKLLPSTVIRQAANERAKEIEQNEGRRVGRQEMRELCETMTIELLPRAFIRRRTTFGWIDPINGWLVVDASTLAKAEEFIEQLRKSVEGLSIKLLKVVQSPSSAMTGWVAEGEAPARFTIDQDLNLDSAEHAQVRYVKHPLEGDEIRQQIACGKIATKLAMTWNDRISFVLTDAMQVKRLVFLDILKEQNEGQADNEDERFDLDFTLMTGETARLLDDLIQALGGETPESTN